MSIQPILGVLLTRFDVGKMAYSDQGEGGEAHKLSNAVVHDVAASLRDDLLVPKCELVRCISFTCDRQATWCEGCHCHEHLLDGPEPWPKKVAKFREASRGCCWKGRRAFSMRHQREQMDSTIASASDDKLRACYAKCSLPQREAMSVLEAELKGRLRENIKAKTKFWLDLPYCIFGIFAVVFQKISLDEAKDIGKEAIKLYDDALRAGLGNKLHRVAHHFLMHDCPLRLELERFVAEGCASLDSCVLLYCELRAYCMCPIVCRRIEAVHSVIRGMKLKATNVSVAWLSAKMRRSDLLRVMDLPDFMQFAQVKWRRRDFYRHTLQCMFPKWRLQTMSSGTCIGWIYQCLVQSQHRDYKKKAGQINYWSKRTKELSKPPMPAVNDVEQALIRFVKSKLSQPICFWSLPAAVFSRGLVSSDAKLCLADEERHVAENLVGHELPADMISMAQAAVDTLTTMSPDDDAVQGPHIFFKVLWCD